VARSARLSGAVAAAALGLTVGHVAARPLRRRLYAAIRGRLGGAGGTRFRTRIGRSGGTPSRDRAR
jgi:hypothetical protein